MVVVVVLGDCWYGEACGGDGLVLVVYGGIMMVVSVTTAIRVTVEISIIFFYQLYILWWYMWCWLR